MLLVAIYILVVGVQFILYGSAHGTHAQSVNDLSLLSVVKLKSGLILMIQSSTLVHDINGWVKPQHVVCLQKYIRLYLGNLPYKFPFKH